MTGYEKACREACRWCADGYLQNYELGERSPTHTTEQGKEVPCTAPALDVWAEQEHARAEAAEARAKAWSDLASAMIAELRQDYAPGTLHETEDECLVAIRKLRAAGRR